MFILQVLGATIFKYPSEKFQYSKVGLLALLLNVGLVIVQICLSGYSIHLLSEKKVTVVYLLTLILTITMIVTRALVIVFNFLLSRKIYNVFESLEKIDTVFDKSGIRMKKNSFWLLALYSAKFLSFLYIHRYSPIVIVSIVCLHGPGDLFCVIVSLLNQRIDAMAYTLR